MGATATEPAVKVASLPFVLHVLIVVLAAIVAWLWLVGGLGTAFVVVVPAVVGTLAAVLVAAYAWQVGHGRSAVNDVRRLRASLARRAGRPAVAAATYAQARDASGIGRVALEAAHDREAADALTDAARAYFALSATVSTAHRHGVVPEALLVRARDAADAAAAQLWRSCDRLSVIGSSRSGRIDEALEAYERAVVAVRDAFDAARDGIIQVAMGGVLEAQLSEITVRLARLDRAARAMDEALAEALR